MSRGNGAKDGPGVFSGLWHFLTEDEVSLCSHGHKQPHSCLFLIHSWDAFHLKAGQLEVVAEEPFFLKAEPCPCAM